MEFDSFVLAAATADLEDEPAARGTADAVEFRMDLAADPLPALDDYDGQLPIIATNRAASEGGEATAPEADRLDVLREAGADEAVAAVDVELDSLRAPPGADLAADVRADDVAVVASVHDFEGTPPTSRLRSLLHEAAAVGDVGKLAVTADDAGDALALLSATRAATAWGDRVATMAMGEAGQHTRAVAPAYGSRIGYAPVDHAEATAPGQYALGELADLVERLGGRDDPRI
jgi:3-dehydroquinate dehydratase-1